MIDFVVEYAKRHRYRTRNLHDGRPVPPCRMDTRKRKRSETSAESFRYCEARCEAIVGQRGYVFAQDGRLEWYMATRQGLRCRAAGILNVGGVVVQDGEGELTGHAPESAIGAVLEAIKAQRVGVGNPHARGNVEALQLHRATRDTEHVLAPGSTISGRVDPGVQLGGDRSLEVTISPLEAPAATEPSS